MSHLTYRVHPIAKLQDLSGRLTIVRDVMPEFPGAINGFLIDDVVLTVDGRSVLSKDHDSIVSLLNTGR